ncbi:MAG TPA: helix-turn-helix domain-containing protein, partial [Chitinophagaceae bacterium]
FSRFQKFNPEEKTTKKLTKNKVEKGASLLATLEMFQEGKSIAEIAAVRNLAVSTVEGHLAQFVKEGKLEITQLVAEERVAAILKTIGEVGTDGLGAIKYRLGDEYSYGEIRAVLNHHFYQQKQTA